MRNISHNIKSTLHNLWNRSIAWMNARLWFIDYNTAKFISKIMNDVAKRPILSRVINSEVFPVLVFFERIRVSMREIVELHEKNFTPSKKNRRFNAMIKVGSYINLIVFSCLIFVLMLMRSLLIASILTGTVVYPVVSIISAYVALIAGLAYVGVNIFRLHILNNKLKSFPKGAPEYLALEKEYYDFKKKLIFNTSWVVYGAIGVIALSINPIAFAVLFVTAFIAYKIYHYYHPKSNSKIDFLSTTYYVDLLSKAWKNRKNSKDQSYRQDSSPDNHPELENGSEPVRDHDINLVSQHRSSAMGEVPSGVDHEKTYISGIFSLGSWVGGNRQEMHEHVDRRPHKPGDTDEEQSDLEQFKIIKNTDDVLQGVNRDATHDSGIFKPKRVRQDEDDLSATAVDQRPDKKPRLVMRPDAKMVD